MAMRIITTLLLMTFLSVGGFAQEKLFNEAIKKGVRSNGAYCVENPKSKNVTVGEMCNYIESKGYIIGKVSNKKIIRFGDSKYLLDKVDFVTRENYATYIFHSLADAGFDFTRLKAKGTLYLTRKEDVYKKGKVPGVKTYAGKQTVYDSYANALWTGSTDDGFIDGTGVGFVAKGSYFMRFEGTFSKGFPSSEIKIRYVSKKDMTSAYVKADEIKSNQYPSVSRMELLPGFTKTDATLKRALMLRTAEFYKVDVVKLNEVYGKLKSVSTTNCGKMTQDNLVYDFIALNEASNYDPQGMKDKVCEMRDVYKVMDALNMKFRDRYYGFSLWSIITMYYEWLGDEVQKDRDLLKTGINLSANLKGKSKYGFGSFMTQAEKELKKKLQQFDTRIENDKAHFDEMRSREMARRDKVDQELSKQVDWDRSKTPSGKLDSGLFDTYWYYENEGEIKFKHGSNVVVYNAYYNDRKGERFSHIGIVYASDDIKRGMGDAYYTHFKNRKEMVDAILKVLR